MPCIGPAPGPGPGAPAAARARARLGLNRDSADMTKRPFGWPRTVPGPRRGKQNPTKGHSYRNLS